MTENEIRITNTIIIKANFSIVGLVFMIDFVFLLFAAIYKLMHTNWQFVKRGF